MRSRYATRAEAASFARLGTQGTQREIGRVTRTEQSFTHQPVGRGHGRIVVSTYEQEQEQEQEQQQEQEWERRCRQPVKGGSLHRGRSRAWP